MAAIDTENGKVGNLAYDTISIMLDGHDLNVEATALTLQFAAGEGDEECVDIQCHAADFTGLDKLQINVESKAGIEVYEIEQKDIVGRLLIDGVATIDKSEIARVAQ